jgi:hypothetical protein
MNRLSIKIVATGFVAMSCGLSVVAMDDLFDCAVSPHANYKGFVRGEERAQLKQQPQSVPGGRIGACPANLTHMHRSTVPVTAAPVTAEQKGKQQAALLEAEEKARIERREQTAVEQAAKALAQAAKLDTQNKADALKAEQDKQAEAARLAAKNRLEEEQVAAALKAAEAPATSVNPVQVIQPEQRSLIQRAWDNKGTLAVGTASLAAVIWWTLSSGKGFSQGPSEASSANNGSMLSKSALENLTGSTSTDHSGK